MNSLFHGGSSSVAALNLPSTETLPFQQPSFFFQRSSQNPHVSFSFTTAKTPKPIRKTRTCCRNGEEEEEEEWTGYRTFVEYGGAAAALFWDDQGKIGDIYTAVSGNGMRSSFTKLDVAIETGIQEAIGVALMDSGDPCFEGKYGLDGFAIGKVGKYSVIDGANIVAGDVLTGFPSSGVHCSGFSLLGSMNLLLKCQQHQNQSA